jgi:hypothetical protein
MVAQMVTTELISVQAISHNSHPPAQTTVVSNFMVVKVPVKV